MSEDTLPKLTISIKGLEDLITVGHALPNIPRTALEPVIYELADLGVDEAKLILEKTSTSEKSTGITAMLMTSITDQMEGDFLISIGPDTRGLGPDSDYPRFLSQPTGPVTQNRPVQLLPYPLRFGFNPLGRWRFIGVRPRIEGHPWMEGVRDKVLQEFRVLYGKELYREIEILNKKISQISMEDVISE